MIDYTHAAREANAQAKRIADYEYRITLFHYIAARSATPAPRAPRVLRKGETVNLTQLASQRVA